MKAAATLLLTSVVLVSPVSLTAQVAGSTVIGVAAAELRQVATGWSAKRQVLGHAVYNDRNERIGTIDDVVIAPDKAISYAIIGVGGFLGVDRHEVAVPVNQFTTAKDKDGKDRFILAGATKEALKSTPAFEYAH